MNGWNLSSPLGNWTTSLVVAIDRSLEPRWGCKGSQAAMWLQSEGHRIPDSPNSWCEDGLLTIYRLGISEFLLEGKAQEVERLRQCQLPKQVYPVLRQDAALTLQGSGLSQLLRQVCSFNFAECDLERRPLLLTSMLDVLVIAVPEANHQSLRLWLDRSYGHYFKETLLDIVKDLRP